MRLGHLIIKDLSKQIVFPFAQTENVRRLTKSDNGESGWVCFVLDLEACQKRIAPPSGVQGNVSIKFFTMSLGKNQRDRTHVRKSCLRAYSSFF